MMNVAASHDLLAPLLEHVAKAMNAGYCANNPLKVGTWPAWEDRTIEFKNYEYWRARHMLAVLLGLHDSVRLERITDNSLYIFAGKAALECARFLSAEPGWEDTYTEAVCKRLEAAIEAARARE